MHASILSAFESITESRPVRIGRVFARRHPRIASSAIFVGGFVVDTITLNRVDAWFDNILLLSYSTALTIIVVLTIRRFPTDGVDTEAADSGSSWLVLASQFLLGALFSASVIFYSQSASLSQASFFLIVLVSLMILNEIIHGKHPRPFVLITLYFFTVTSFLTFFIPVVTRKMSTFTFLAAGIVGFALVGMVLKFSQRGAVRRQLVRRTVISVATLWMIVLLFYFNRWIPPVPLALRDGDTYAKVEKYGDEYKMVSYKTAWYEHLPGVEKSIPYTNGDTVFAFSSVFAPTDLSRQIEHQWKYKDIESGDWTVTDRLPYEVTGGRREGYRGFTFKRNLHPGRWRVDIITDENWIIGRLRFRLVPANSTHEHSAGNH